MNADLKAKWIAALRSGKYKQGHGRLRIDNQFCCLGVLCDVSHVPYAFGLYDFGDGQRFSEALRGDLCKAIGGEGVQDTLITLNDEQGKSFAEIADWIERHVDAT